MICENCSFEVCKQVDPFFIQWYCPCCEQTFKPSEDHKFFMKLKENLTIKFEETSTNYFLISLQYKDKEICSDGICLPIYREYD